MVIPIGSIVVPFWDNLIGSQIRTTKGTTMEPVGLSRGFRLQFPAEGSAALTRTDEPLLRISVRFRDGVEG